jgi:N-acetylglucosamine-6-sulfatase
MASFGSPSRRGQRRNAALVVCLLLSLVPLAGCDLSGEPSSADDGPPNVVVVMTDDQDVDSMDVMPTVRRELVEQGVQFEKSYVGLSECCPSRATFLTGQHAHNSGVATSKPPQGGYPALDGSSTLAVWLDEAGYRTGMVGRYLNYYGNANAGTDPKEVPPGWDDWRVPVEHTEFQMYDYVLNENGRLHQYGSAPSDYSTDVLARKAVDFVDGSSRRDAPFFLWVTPLAPHAEGVLDDVPTAPRNPRPAPRDEGAFEDRAFSPGPSAREWDVSDKPQIVQSRSKPRVPSGRTLEASYRGRLESLLAVDRMVGQIVEALERSEELDNTYVIFTSDNGYMLGEHGLIGKHLPYEESVRVPLVIRGPDIPAGTNQEQLVQNIDLAPTIVDISGAAADRRMDGISLLPLASGEPGPERDLLLEYLEGEEQFAGIRSRDGYVYVEYVGGASELYDLGRDPGQLENVVDEAAYADVRDELAERLADLKDCSGEECR